MNLKGNQMEKYARLRTFAQKDTAFSHFLRFLFHFLRHWLSQVIISIIGTIIIALFIGLQRFNLWFYVSCAIYLALLIGTAICKGYDKSTLVEAQNTTRKYSEELSISEKEVAMLNETLMSMTTIMSVESKHIYRVARGIKHKGWSKKLEDYREQYSFQLEAIAICEEVYKIINKQFGITDHWVTIYQRFEDKGGDYCKMIGYYNAGYQEPSSYPNEYKLKIGKKKVELHTRLLAKSESSIEILVTPEEIKKEFKYHKESESREQKLKQYIGIAETVCHRSATILLQIDTNKENGFGESKDKIIEFVRTYIKPFVVLLVLHYENNRLFEMCYNHAFDHSMITQDQEEEPEYEED